ncbi:CsbD family protein [Pseudonocardia parietis]|nr:CsbD family protein [Pseudonocardia parietis]
MSPKETIGRLSGNEKLETEGKTEQRKSKLKQAGNQAKDAFKK